MGVIMSMLSEGGDGTVRITSREIYDELRVLSGDVREALRIIPANEAAHAVAHTEFRRRLENHGDRMHTVEQAASANTTTSVETTRKVRELDIEVDVLKAQQNRQAWVPALVAGLIPTIIGAIIIANLLPAIT